MIGELRSRGACDALWVAIAPGTGPNIGYNNNSYCFLCRIQANRLNLALTCWRREVDYRGVFPSKLAMERMTPHSSISNFI